MTFPPDRGLQKIVRSVIFAALSLAAVGCGAGGMNGPSGTGGANTGTGGAGTGGAGTGTGTGGTGTGTGGTSTGGSGSGGGTGRACGAGDVRQAFPFEVELPPGMPALGVAQFSGLTRDVTGPVTAVERVDTAVRIEVTEAGKAWAVVVHPGSSLEVFEAAASALANTTVKLRIRLKRAWQIMPSWGFVLRSANDDLLMAVEAGPFTQALEAPDIAPLALTNGAPVCDQMICGNVLWAYSQLHVSSSDGASVSVDIGSNGELTSTNRRYTIRNVGAGRLAMGTGFTCADIEKTPTWALWSRPSAQ